MKKMKFNSTRSLKPTVLYGNKTLDILSLTECFPGLSINHTLTSQMLLKESINSICEKKKSIQILIRNLMFLDLKDLPQECFINNSIRVNWKNYKNDLFHLNKFKKKKISLI
jgi:hypothetical protein